MEKKIKTSNTEKKKTTKKEPVAKKKSTLSRKKVTKKKTKAFTLIELLAVIIILGVLMIIAIPSVTTYISDSRKSSYIDTAKNMVGAARNLVNSGKLEMYDPSTTYYIPLSCIKTENGAKTPYGDFAENAAFVAVTFDGNGYDYYWTSTDTSNTGIKNLVPYDKLDVDKIESGVKSTDIRTDIAIDGKENIIVFNGDCTDKEDVIIASTVVNPDGSEIVVPEPSEGDYYYNANKRKYYSNLTSAINDASSNQTIKVVDYAEETNTITIPSSLTGLKIDSNGNTISFNWQLEHPIINNGQIILINSNTDPDNYSFSFDMWTPVLNNGTIEVRDRFIFRSENLAIENHGTVDVLGGEVFGYDSDGIDNYGVINVSGGEVNGYSTGIDNHNILNVTGGEVSGHSAIGNYEGATLNISGSALINGNQTAIGNSGTVNANGGKIQVDYAWGGYGIVNSGTVTINNTEIYVRGNSGYSAYAIQNLAGNIIINSGTVTAVGSSYGIYNEANLTIKSGEITTNKTPGLYLKGNSTTTITGGKISGYSSAIEALDNYTLTIGSNDGTISTTSPEIKTTYNYGTGIKLGNAGTFNFYDGVIKFSNNTNYCINGTAASMNYPQGYTLHTELNNSIGTGYLVRQ